MSTIAIVAAIVLVIFNGFFVAAEYAIVAIRRTRVEELVSRGSRAAKLVGRIKHDFEAYSTASQLGITLASLGMGALEPIIADGLPFGKINHVVGGIIAFTAITYVHVVFGELGPKWAAIAKPDRVALVTALPFHLFYRLFFPLIWLVTTSAGLILKPLGVHPASESDSALSEEELRLALSQSQEAQAIPEVAEEIADRAFHFGRGKVRDVMTPRPDVAYLSTTRTLAQNLDVIRRTNFARYPVCRESLDDVIGRIHVRDLLTTAYADQNGSEERDFALNLERLATPVLFVPEVKSLEAMLDDFRLNRMEMAVVQDEYGVTAGVVTMEDVLEELVGEIQQEFAHSLSEVQAFPDGSYLVDSNVTLSRLKREYNVGQEVPDIETIGGFVLSTLSTNPRVGYQTSLDGWHAEITELAGRRIRRVRLTPSEASRRHTEDPRVGEETAPRRPRDADAPQP